MFGVFAWSEEGPTTVLELKSLTHIMSQEACHSRRWSGLSPQEHPRAAAAGGVLSYQLTASGGTWAETHRELLESALALLLPFLYYLGRG